MVHLRTTLVLVLLVACGSKDASSGADREPPAAKPQRPLDVHRFESSEVPLPRLAQFSLIQPGAQPRSALRYEARAASASYTIETALRSRQLRNRTWSDERAVPPIRNRLEIATSTSGPVTARPLRGEIVGTATPEATQYLATWNALEDREVSLAMTDRGLLERLRFADDPSNARSAREVDDLLQRFLVLLVPVPEEPVGVGASWRVVTILRQHPAVVKQTATYTLRARTDERWTIDVEITRLGEAQTLLEPGTPPDTVLELIALVRKLHGTVEIARGMPLPTGELAVTSTLHVQIRQRAKAAAEEIVEDVGTIAISREPVRHP